MGPLHVALVWHMHQPYYRDDLTGEFLLPWARLRASKDYGRMLRLACAYPDLRVTFNHVPSLLEQLAAYGDDQGEDLHRELCRRDAGSLSAGERRFLVRTAQTTTYSQKVPQFDRLHALLGRLGTDPEAADRLTTDEIRDLQAWMLLAWIDIADILADAHLEDVLLRGRNLTEYDKQLVDERQMALVRRVVGELRQAIAVGVVEPMTSPAYHPILPLLVDTGSARVARPGLALPAVPFQHPEDAFEQIRRGLDTFETHTGVRPAGMWPSECSVSPEAARLMAQAGVRWAISDEGVLGHSLGRVMRGGAEEMRLLNSPWRDPSGLKLVFRDAALSNRIGFDYAHLPAADAVHDLVTRLEEIARAQPEGEEWLVVLALDGENCWEWYEEDGNPFLHRLYTALTLTPWLRSTHIGDFLERHPHDVRPLEQLWSGSWIDADFTTWIGARDHSRAWELLAAARAALDEAGGPAAHPEAYREMLVCEGSDTFWWFGPHHDSQMDEAWDALYRRHLRNVYRLLGRDAPADLLRPILRIPTRRAALPPVRAISPRPERGADDPEWQAAGVIEVGASLGAMHPARSTVGRLLYGVDPHRLHLRFGDTSPAFSSAEVQVATLDGSGGRRVTTVTVRRTGRGYDVELEPRRESATQPRIAATAPLRLSVPLPLLAAGGGDVLEVGVLLEEPGRGREQVPADAPLRLRAPRATLADDAAQAPARILAIAMEATGAVRVGGLGDAVTGLAEALLREGNEVAVMLPMHRGFDLEQSPLAVRIEDLEVPFGGEVVHCRLLQGTLGEGDVSLFALDCPRFFERPSVYGEADDADRCLFLSRAAVAALRAVDLRPTVVHAHAWHTAAVPALLRAHASADPALAAAATILSTHDLRHQGVVNRSHAFQDRLDVDAPGVGEDLNLLALGTDHADVVVVPSEEAMRATPAEVGEVLASALRRNAGRVRAVADADSPGDWDAAAVVLARAARDAGAVPR